MTMEAAAMGIGRVIGRGRFDPVEFGAKRLT
jgi:hypothetical protein